MNRFRDRRTLLTARGAARSRLSGRTVLRVTLILFALLCVSLPGTDRAVQARPQRAPAFTPILQVSPTSGLAGSTVALDGSGYQRVADLAPATITFDDTNLGTTPISSCNQTASVAVVSGFGFGTMCTGTAVTVTVPQDATPGVHTFTVTGHDDSGNQYPASASFTVLAPPTLDLNPNTGPSGSLTSISVVNFPNTTAQQQAAITWDGAGIAQLLVLQCTAAGQPSGSFGFGADCIASPDLLPIPSSAQPGAHTVAVVAPAPNDPAGSVSVTGIFTVTAPTVTMTPSPAPTTTGTATASATGTATATGVPATASATPSAPAPTASASATAAPLSSATSTAVPTATSVPRPQLVLIKPLFDQDSLYLVLSADSAAAVHVTLRVVSMHGSTAGAQQYAVTLDGMTSARGIFSGVVHLKFHAHIQGRADLTIATMRGGHAVKVSRSFGYGVGM